MPQNPYPDRVQRVLSAMEAGGVDCLLVGVSPALRYLTGYGGKADERLLLLVLSPGHPPFIVANQLYTLQLEGTGVRRFRWWKDGENAVATLLDELRPLPTGTVAVDKSLPASFLLPITQGLAGSRFTLAGPLIDPLRLYKDETERAHMRQACRRAAEALQAVLALGSDLVGQTEAQFMARLAYEMTVRGLKNPSGIVAVGENAAAPHHLPDDTVIQRGKCLLVDFGGNFMGYHTDMTRTVFFGQPDEAFTTVYHTVLEALYAGHGAAVLGRQLQEVDRAARGVITRAGYGDYFTHRTGHGIGLDGHEGPPAGEGETTLMAPGMAFSIEPGIYLPGKFGVRIEDQALMTEGGLEILHDMSRELCIFH